MSRTKQGTAFRTCVCGSINFRVVGYRNATYLWCAGCRKYAWMRSAIGCLARKELLPREIAAFERAVAHEEQDRIDAYQAGD